jgi:PAS domain S-box-containing protein
VLERFVDHLGLKDLTLMVHRVGRCILAASAVSQSVVRALAVLHVVRHSLLVPLLGVYLLFVAAVLGAYLEVYSVAQQQVRAEVQTTDLALAQQIALDTDTELRGIEGALVQLSHLAVVRQGHTGAMASAFQAFKAARPDVDLVYWLDARGTLQVSYPPNLRTLGATYSSQQFFQRARVASGPIVEDGIVDLTTFDAVVTFAVPVRDRAGHLRGILATNLLLDDLSASLQTIIAAQAQQGQHLLISIVDAQGRLIATPQSERILQPVLEQLPGAADALAGHTQTRTGTDPQGQQWLYSAVPVPSAGWAVVVQRPTAEVLAAVTNFRTWITVAAGLFALGGLLFWLVLLRRVVQPLRALATRHAALPTPDSPALAELPAFSGRSDEIGGLARSLSRLEHDVIAQLAELRTLLATSNAVVTSLDPRAVGRTIIREVQRLVDVQAAAVLVPDEDGVLRVLVSEGGDDHYQHAVRIRPDDLGSPAALALRDGRAVQLVAGDGSPFPPLSYAEGFRAVLAIPIISRHVGGVVLVVHRTQPQRFTAHEVDLLLTFANYATLAWEHAVLYERSDERLREVARENERLYRQATAEKQTLAAIMRSMSDGLILTSVDGRVLYANPGAGAITGLPATVLEGSHIETIYEALHAKAQDPAGYDRRLARARAGEVSTWVLETGSSAHYQAINVRHFDVRDDAGQTIGRGLLLRDVTRERELDQFKTTLLGAVGHELRTPLAAIKGYASTLLQDDVAWSIDDQRSFLHTISAEADRLAQLVSNLLDLSRLEAGLLLLRRAPCRLEGLVASAVRRVGAPAPGLSVAIPADLPTLDVDGARIEVVLHNLLVNALAYGNGHVRITAAQHAGGVLVRVADDGPGIDEDELPHIFERFYRATRGHQQRSGGTGLGLAICKAFVEAHEGAIWAESGARGTIISFTVPAAPASGEPAVREGLRVQPARAS